MSFTVPPGFVREVVFPLQEWLKGKKTHVILRELERSQWFSHNQLLELQFARLKVHLEYAYQYVPYYQDLFNEHDCPPHRIQDLSDFQRIPFLTREALREQFDRLRSSAPLRGVQRMSTGGSTGSPVAILVDAERSALSDAIRLRTHRWFGADMGVKEVVLWGSPIEITRQDYLRLVRDRLLNSFLLSAFNLGPAKLEEYSDFILRYEPAKMYGYASALYLLASYIQQNKKAVPKSLKVVFATAEPLFDFQRDTIEQTFDAKVSTEYGARDAGLMALECPQGGFHVPVEGMIVEIVGADSSGMGEVVVTNLFSRAMPIVRYRTGDMAQLSGQSCSCGRGLPLLKKVEGRQTDFIVTPDKRVIHALAVIYVLRDCPEIEKFQVVQESLQQLVASVVSRRGLTADQKAKLLSGLHKAVGPGVNIDLVTVPEIPTSASGKFRYVISKVSSSHLSEPLESLA